ncbi:eotaxin-like [Ambystoma mexicanum]|uniref:eotaxin-like n=1 Tax=Ambystoma mexicanum TaxID=8296 RepID=UPI0037E880E5
MASVTVCSYRGISFLLAPHCKMAFNRYVLGASAVLLLCLAAAMGNDYRRPSKVTTRCCKNVSKSRIPFAITDYRIQNHFEACVYAVIFTTERKGAFCADPKAPWVLKMIRNLKNKQQKGQ